MNSLLNVKLSCPAVYCFLGADWNTVWEKLINTCTVSDQTVIESNSDNRSLCTSFALQEPSLVMMGVDRKAVRTTEKQARLAIFGAQQVIRQKMPDELAQISAYRRGLYLGFPTIDEEAPPLPALLRRFEETPSKKEWLDILLSEMPPFFGLSMTNSSACAHISATLGIEGAMAAFSPFSDAGLQALIEGVLSVSEHENDIAIIGAISPKIHPLLSIQYNYLFPAFQEHNILPGEGSCFFMAEKITEPDLLPFTIHLAGFSRAFVDPKKENGAFVFLQAIKKALHMGGIEPWQIGWILTPSTGCIKMDVLQRTVLKQCAEHLPETAFTLPIEKRMGFLGAAQALLHTGIAYHGLNIHRKLVTNEFTQIIEEKPLDHSIALLTTWSPHGQLVVIILKREGRDE